MTPASDAKHVCGLRGFAESGDACPGCAPSISAQDATEREHCAQAIEDVACRLEKGRSAKAVKAVWERWIAMLLRERADAYKAGFEAGRKAGGK